MAKPPRTATTGTFFITAITYKRRRLFQLPTNAELFIETLQHYRHKGLFKLHAFVVMPDHIHLLLTTDDLSRSVRHIKGGFSHRLASHLPVWQRSFTDHRIRDNADFETHRSYIHHNPIRAHLAVTADLYLFSSASIQP